MKTADSTVIIQTDDVMNAVNYQIADITLCVLSDLPITRHTFACKLDPFRVKSIGEDTLTLHHHFNLPNLTQQVSGINIPWTITRDGTRWVYDRYLHSSFGIKRSLRVEWDEDYARGDIYHTDDTRFRRGGMESLTGMTTDQILIGRVLAERSGFLLHAAGMVLAESGFLFVGHSSAGKSTIVSLLRDQGEILCDDRIAVRRKPEGFRQYGTWSHGDVPDISPASAPIKAICFLEQADTNQAIPITDRREILSRLLPCLIKPYVDAQWWEKILSTVGLLIDQVPAYRLLFDRSGQVVQTLRNLL